MLAPDAGVTLFEILGPPEMVGPSCFLRGICLLSGSLPRFSKAIKAKPEYGRSLSAISASLREAGFAFVQTLSVSPAKSLRNDML
jgi:hypothetical protein